MLLYRMTLVSFRLFRENLGNMREIFGQIVYRPSWPKIARTPICCLNTRKLIFGRSGLFYEQLCKALV